MADPRFDIIIVGGGTAGCVLASRLSAAPHLRVLLLEAGGDHNDDPKVQTPLLSRRMFKDPDYDWGYETTPQVGLAGRVIQQTRGRMIGGSSAINSNSLVFPNREMHDTWARMIGDDRWGWAQMQDAYVRCYEEGVGSGSSDAVSDPAGAGMTGPVKASYPCEVNILQKAWEDTFAALHMKSQAAGSSGKCFGAFTTTNAIDGRPGRGERSHAGNAYLQPISGRSNLTIETGAVVSQVVFGTSSGNDTAPLTAVGVKYEKDGKQMLAEVKGEVIICGGTFASPQLLELSGIGNREILHRAGVECLIDLPGVGENLQDHLNFGPSVEVGSHIETLDIAAQDPSVMAAWKEQYLQSRTGPVAEGAAYSFAFWPLQLFNTPSEEAELSRLLDSTVLEVDDKGRSQKEDYIKRMVLSPDEASATVFMTRRQRYTAAGEEADGNYMSIIAMLSHPFSCGSSHIKTADPADHPGIDCAYLSHPLDAEILSRHCLQIERLLEQPTYADIVKSQGNRLPRDYAKPFETLDDAKSAIRKYGATNYHPCGTCAMMVAEDGGVVDADLRVYGTSNLRVCDASIFPIIPRGNILTTVYAVAEKAADFVSQEHSR